MFGSFLLVFIHFGLSSSIAAYVANVLEEHCSTVISEEYVNL